MEDMTMQEQIGQMAGAVWQHLDHQGETSVASLKNALKADLNILLMAIGWLAREDKVALRTAGAKKTLYVALK